MPGGLVGLGKALRRERDLERLRQDRLLDMISSCRANHPHQIKAST